ESLQTRFPGEGQEDLVRGVEFLAGKDYIDPHRVAISGGLSAAWAIGHSDRFTAAVVWPPQWRKAGAWLFPQPWQNAAEYVEQLPVYFADHFKARTLVLAEDGDSQSVELYQALAARGIECALLRAGRTPGDRIADWATILTWLARN